MSMSFNTCRLIPWGNLSRPQALASWGSDEAYLLPPGGLEVDLPREESLSNHTVCATAPNFLGPRVGKTSLPTYHFEDQGLEALLSIGVEVDVPFVGGGALYNGGGHVSQNPPTSIRGAFCVHTPQWDDITQY